MNNLLDDMGMESVHASTATKEPVMAKKTPRKNRKKKPAVQPVMAKKTGRRYRKGLSMKIKSDGSVHVRHLNDVTNCVAIMPPMAIDLVQH